MTTAIIVTLLVLPEVFIFALMRRARYYRALATQLAATLQSEDASFPMPAASPDFSKRVALIANVLPETQFSSLRSEVLGLTAIERSYVPTHKKGGTVAYENLIQRAPEAIRLYHAKSLHRVLSRMTGVELCPTPIRDQSSLSILVYEQPGDHIDWHYDHNFYRGRHFTVLLPIVNSGYGHEGLSHAELSAKIDGGACSIETRPNSLIVFEGAKLLHKVSPIKEGERRILLSMTFCADPRATWFQEVARRLKDTAFFGVRALWT